MPGVGDGEGWVGKAVGVGVRAGIMGVFVGDKAGTEMGLTVSVGSGVGVTERNPDTSVQANTRTEQQIKISFI